MVDANILHVSVQLVGLYKIQ